MKNILKYTLAMLTIAGSLQADLIRFLNDSQTDELCLALVCTAKKDPSHGITSANTVIKFTRPAMNTLVLGSTIDSLIRLPKKHYVDMNNFQPGLYDRTLWVGSEAALSAALEAGALHGQLSISGSTGSVITEQGIVSFVEVGGYTKGVAIQSAGGGKFKFNLFRIGTVKTTSGETGIKLDEARFTTRSMGTEPKKIGEEQLVVNDSTDNLYIALVNAVPGRPNNLQLGGRYYMMSGDAEFPRLSRIDLPKFPTGTPSVVWVSSDLAGLKDALKAGTTEKKAGTAEKPKVLIADVTNSRGMGLRIMGGDGAYNFGRITPKDIESRHLGRPQEDNHVVGMIRR